MASGLYFLAGGDVLLASLIQADLAEALPGEALEGIQAEFVRTAVEGRLMGWVAIVRFFSLIPLGFALGMGGRRQEPRVAPGAVLAMHYLSVSFLLSVFMTVGVWGWSQAAGGEAASVADWLFGLDRIVMLVWLVIGIRVLWDRGWFSSGAMGLAVALLDLVLIFLAFAGSFGAMEVLLER